MNQKNKSIELLTFFELPVIKSIQDFSELTHISKYTLYQLSINANRYYKIYSIPKKSGKLRIISQPSKKLKGIQAWILVNILNKLSVSTNCKGFEIGSSTSDNAQAHVGAKTLLTIDLEDFFPTITQKQVFNVFRCIGYNSTISVFLSNICTYNETLPQGSPTSPKLANLCTWNLDVRIQGYVTKKGITYTRYADDMTFSSNSMNNLSGILPMLRRIIISEKFVINEKKTRLARKSNAKIVTGLVLTDDSYGIGRKKYKILRTEIYSLTLPIEQDNTSLLNKVRGSLSYLNSVDSKRLLKAKKYINKLAISHPETLIVNLLQTSPYQADYSIEFVENKSSSIIKHEYID